MGVSQAWPILRTPDLGGAWLAAQVGREIIGPPEPGI
jgi:hypothetical protein